MGYNVNFFSSYENLIVQFEAVSYGSPLFGAFLLLPLRQKEPLSFRTKLWCEHTDAVRCISITCDKVLPTLHFHLSNANHGIFLESVAIPSSRMARALGNRRDPTKEIRCVH